MMIISGFFLFMKRYREGSCACFLLPGLSLVFLSVGMGALFLDLEHKLFVWRLYTTFEPTSPMSWGSWILLAVYPALIANLLLRLPAPLAGRLPSAAGLSEALLARPALVQTIGAVNMGLGVSLGIYTGILLSSLGARPLWNSALLGPLFLVSGLSTAAAFVHMVARNRAEREMLAKADNGFLVAEFTVIGLFLIGLLTASHSHVEAARLFLGGPYTAVFWVLVVALGILVPLFVQSLAVNHRIQHTSIAPILVIVGGLVLRFVIVNAGQFSHWSQWSTLSQLNQPNLLGLLH
jgi:formate-dependent nitrite reductase membrane component NrfD